MHNDIRELIGCLDLEKDLYANLHKLSSLKQTIIGKGEAAALDEITAKERVLLDKLCEREKVRHEIVACISKKLNLLGEHITLSNIIDAIDDDCLKQKLTTIIDEFNVIFQKQKKLNETNQMLLEKNISYLDFMINAATAGRESIIYSGKGCNERQKQNINIFDKRA
ncbi:MAG: flagellar protein FlgN [Firmicutes bacterium]|nr:flagellar protein FlgN [Bacillota bacterium]